MTASYRWKLGMYDTGLDNAQLQSLVMELFDPLTAGGDAFIEDPWPPFRPHIILPGLMYDGVQRRSALDG